MISLIVSIIILAAVIILALRFAVELVYVIAAVISYRAKNAHDSTLSLAALTPAHIFFISVLADESIGKGRMVDLGYGVSNYLKGSVKLLIMLVLAAVLFIISGIGGFGVNIIKMIWSSILTIKYLIDNGVNIFSNHLANKVTDVTAPKITTIAD
jgi:hypothetical protein